MMTETNFPATTLPEWVSKMREHFREHGFYRPEDMDRVLGSPKTHVEVIVSGGTAANILTTKSG
jgi:hypothetical protein